MRLFYKEHPGEVGSRVTGRGLCPRAAAAAQQACACPLSLHRLVGRQRSNILRNVVRLRLHHHHLQEGGANLR